MGQQGGQGEEAQSTVLILASRLMDDWRLSLVWPKDAVVAGHSSMEVLPAWNY
jgi:hypothetical protein